jgi:hypothetical protein
MAGSQSRRMSTEAKAPAEKLSTANRRNPEEPLLIASDRLSRDVISKAQAP